MIESQYINDDKELTCEDDRGMLVKRFEEIDYEDAKADVLRFIKNNNKIDIWSKEFFTAITMNLHEK